MSTLSAVADVATLLEAIAVVVSVILILVQVAEGNRLARSANATSIVNLASPHYQVMLNPETAKLWATGIEKPSNLRKGERLRFRNFLIWWLLIHENIYFQKQKNLLDDDVYASWNKDLEQLASKKGLREFWDELKPFYQPRFAAVLSDLVNNS